tara:strand:- start:12329 stop:12625 length:297 start_codon:yes stop_codon:yes gene_type:complete
MSGPLLIGPLGPLELAIIVGVIVLLFGVGRISRIGGDLGSSIKEFRRAVRDDETEEEGATQEVKAETQPETPPPSASQQPAAPPTETPPSDSGTRNVF